MLSEIAYVLQYSITLCSALLTHYKQSDLKQKHTLSTSTVSQEQAW